jgi:hypothetical protein
MKKDILWQAALVVLGGLSSAYAGYWIANLPDEGGIVNYAIANDEGLKRIFGSSSDLRLNYKGQPLNDISRVNIWIANASRKSADKVQIYLEVKDKTRSAIVADYDVPQGLPRDIVRPLPAANGIYPFEIRYMNRSEDILDGYRFSLYFSGSKSPEIDVTMAAKNLSLQKKDSPFTLDKSSLFLKSMRSMWSLLTLYLVLWALTSFLISRYERARRSLRETRVTQILDDVTSRPLPQDMTKDEYLSSIREQILGSPSFIDVMKVALKRLA